MKIAIAIFSYKFIYLWGQVFLLIFLLESMVICTFFENENVSYLYQAKYIYFIN